MKQLKKLKLIARKTKYQEMQRRKGFKKYNLQWIRNVRMDLMKLRKSLILFSIMITYL